MKLITILTVSMGTSSRGLDVLILDLSVLAGGHEVPVECHMDIRNLGLEFVISGPLEQIVQATGVLRTRAAEFADMVRDKAKSWGFPAQPIPLLPPSRRKGVKGR